MGLNVCCIYPIVGPFPFKALMIGNFSPIEIFKHSSVLTWTKIFRHWTRNTIWLGMDDVLIHSNLREIIVYSFNRFPCFVISIRLLLRLSATLFFIHVLKWKELSCRMRCLLLLLVLLLCLFCFPSILPNLKAMNEVMSRLWYLLLLHTYYNFYVLMPLFTFFGSLKPHIFGHLAYLYEHWLQLLVSVRCYVSYAFLSAIWTKCFVWHPHNFPLSLSWLVLSSLK